MTKQQRAKWMQGMTTLACALAIMAGVCVGMPALADEPEDMPMLPKEKAPEAVPASDKDKKSDDKSDEKSSKHDGPTRIAVLDFGAPGFWKEHIGNTVGSEIRAQVFADVVPMLMKDHVDVVVIRVNSGGGALTEIYKFHQLFNDVFKKKFRTVAWIESAISAAAMSPYILDEIYFMPGGSFGACTGWHQDRNGGLVNLEGPGLQEILDRMATVSRLTNRDPSIMRAMQIQEFLSVDIDEHGAVHWRQDDKGQELLDNGKEIFAFTAEQAMKYKFGSGIAANVDELAKAMQLREYVVAGKEASDYIDKNLRESGVIANKFDEVLQKYGRAFNIAEKIPVQDKKRRGIEINQARRFLSELRTMYKTSPGPGAKYGIDGMGWFTEQEDELRKLLKE